MNVSKTLNTVYGFAKHTIVPSLRYSQDIYEEVLASKVTRESSWLDIGCGHQVLPSWKLLNEKELVSRSRFVVGIDYDHPSLLKHSTIDKRVRGSANSLPFDDNSFDLVTANMVVEHLDNPAVQFAEINRVLRPNGNFLFHTVNGSGYFAAIRRILPTQWVRPIAKALDGRSSDDVFEVEYKANEEREIQRLAVQSNFEVDTLRMISSDAVSANILPFAVVELLWIRLLMQKRFREYRTNLIVILRKSAVD